MSRTHAPLGPSTIGRESLKLQANLRKSIVGQEEAIREIVSIYQMYLAGMNARSGHWEPSLWPNGRVIGEAGR